MAYAFAFTTVILCIAVYICAAWTPPWRSSPVWPSQSFGPRERAITWAVTIVAIASAYQAGLASWNAWGWPGWLRWFIGFPVCFVASSLSSYAIVQLGLDQSMGANHALKTGGLFARCRNPTYIANVALCAGFVMLAASTPALIAAGALGLLYVAVVPLEENWLRNTYGEAYSAYREKTPRWW